MKNNKTQTAREEVINYLTSSVPEGATFTSTEIATKFNHSATHLVTISHLLKMGHIYKIKRGVYKCFTTLFTDDNLAKKIKDHANKTQRGYYDAKRERSVKEVEALKIPLNLKAITTITDYPDGTLIEELKRRGYKIMKPVNQYEEV
jgi:hypothetical protein